MNSKVDGLCYRIKEKVFVNKKAIVKDLNELPIPARHLIDLKKYCHTPFEYTDHRNTFMITSRGCNFSCITCYAGIYRSRSPQNVIDEIKELLSKGIHDITFFDACFSMDMRRAESICDLIIKEGLRFSWACETRVDRVDPNLLAKMSQAGCRSIMYGIESGNAENLALMDKRIGLEKIRKSVSLTRKCGMKVYGSFMLGFPEETIEGMKETIEFSKGLDLDLAWFTIVTPIPCTGSWKLTEYDENDLQTLEKISFYSGDISFAEKNIIEDIYSKAIRSFYLRPKMIWRILSDILLYGTLKRKLHYLSILPTIMPVVLRGIGR